MSIIRNINTQKKEMMTKDIDSSNKCVFIARTQSMDIDEGLGYTLI